LQQNVKMSSKNSGIMDKLNCYNKILDCFLKNQNDYYQLENCKNKSIIKLMNILKQSNDKPFVKNALVFVLSLFNCHLPSDLYNSRGRNLKHCDAKEKEIIISVLKNEFL